MVLGNYVFSAADAELFCLVFAVLYLMFLCLKIILFMLSLIVLKIFPSVTCLPVIKR